MLVIFQCYHSNLLHISSSKFYRCIAQRIGKKLCKLTFWKPLVLGSVLLSLTTMVFSDFPPITSGIEIFVQRQLIALYSTDNHILLILCYLSVLILFSDITYKYHGWYAASCQFLESLLCLCRPYFSNIFANLPPVSSQASFNPPLLAHAKFQPLLPQLIILTKLHYSNHRLFWPK